MLLNRFRDDAEEAGYAIAMIEAHETGRFAPLLAKELRRVLLRLDSIGAVLVKRALRAVKSFAVSVNPEGELSLSWAGEREEGLADSGILSEDLADILVAVGEAAQERRTGVLIAIDELQYLNAEELGGLISAIHKTTQRSLPIVLVGAGLPQLPGLAGNAKSYAERLFAFPTIGSLNESEATAAIARPAAQLNVLFQPGAISTIVRVTKGYPYFLQEWAYEVWNVAEESPISVADVDAAKAAVLDKLDENFFRVRFDRLTPSERRYLRAMAEIGPGPYRSGDVAAMYGAKVESVGPLRAQLIKKGMIYSPAYGDNAFTVPLFDEFMKRAIPHQSR